MSGLNTPNPFADAATIILALPNPRPVHAEVLGPLGRRVVLPHDGPLGIGLRASYVEAGAVPPGVYLARVVAGDETCTRWLTLLR